MRVIEFEILGEVIPKGRPRFARRGKSVHTYTPKKTQVYEAVVRQYARINITEPLEGALEVSIVVKKRPPKSWSKKKQKAALEGTIRPTSKPDADNYAKSILDGMDKVAFEDDGQICRLSVSKEYAAEDSAVVRISELDGENAY